MEKGRDERKRIAGITSGKEGAVEIRRGGAACLLPPTFKIDPRPHWRFFGIRFRI